LLYFLTSKGLYFCGNENLETLQNISRNYFKQFSQRGTLMVFKKQGEVLLDGTTNTIKGELLRIICHQQNDEFLYTFNSNNWIVGRTSPIYKGLGDVNTNKELSDTKDMASLSKYDKVGTVQEVTYDGISIKQTGCLFEVDINLDYEYSFFLQTLQTGNALDFSVNALDINNTIIPDAFLDKDNLDRSVFFYSTQCPKAVFGVNKFYLVRGIIFAKDTDLYDKKYNNELNWNGSTPDEHVKFKNLSAIKKISVNIGHPSVDGTERKIRICNLKLRPLKTNYSRYFVQGKDFMDFFLKKNNKTISNQELENIMRKELLPLSVNFRINYL
jgi:hypothetical protein